MATGGICSSEHSGPVPTVGPGPDTERLSAASVDRQFSHMRRLQRAEKKALTAGARKAVTSPHHRQHRGGIIVTIIIS